MHRAVCCLALLCLACSATHSQAQSVTVNDLYPFTGGTANSASPFGGVIMASDGNFYGTTIGGGASGDGTFFKLSPSGTYTLLYSFTGGSDGAQPYGRVIEGPDGNFYGTTQRGAVGPANCGTSGCGTIYKLAPQGITVLYTFKNGADGAQPEAGLILGNDGNFYGTTNGGTTGEPIGAAPGSIFKITPTGTFTTLHSMNGTTDGSQIQAPVIQGLDGNFYGTSNENGADNNGTAFQVTPSGTFTLLHTFTGGASDGGSPSNGLIQGNDGNFYGTTTAGGADNAGTFFKVTPSGAFTPVSSFTGGAAGQYAFSPLAVDSGGNFYGGMGFGGILDDCSITGMADVGCGTIYQITMSGTFTNLYSFTGTTNDGANPFGALIQGSSGNFYGIAGGGGNVGDCPETHNTAAGCGTVFDFAYNALSDPIQLSFNRSSIGLGTSATLSWTVYNAFSLTAQQCYAYVQDSATGAGSWTGKQSGTYNSTTHILSGSTTIAPTAAGAYTYALTCGGAESGFATLTVTPSGKLTSSTTLSSSINPVTIGQNFLLSSTVSGSGATPTGTVTFLYGSTTLKVANLSSGTATDTVDAADITTIPPGKYALTASYSGDSNYNASTSSPYTVTLNPAPTSTVLTANPMTVTPPNSVALTATVSRSTSGATGTPAGSVTFYYMTTSLGSGMLKSGVATLTAGTSGIPAGSYGITAKYNGDSDDTTSTSNKVTVKVN